MAEPVIVLELNEGTEGAPTWAAIGDAGRFVGPNAADGALTDPFSAPAADADDAFFDNAAAPNNGELWNEKPAAADTHCTLAGRNANQNVLRARETGGADGTSGTPELSAYDDAAEAATRTAPALWLLVGTAGTSSVGCVRGIETTAAAPGAGWTGQVHASAPAAGAVLEGNVTKVTCATALAANGNKTFNLAVCAPHDSTPGLSSFVLALQYQYV